ncbi:MAG: hypothetical protein H7Z40_12115 [Phycisphaerae bacterium]|nr:hypothetical protein [Gemmatimonadaceae bacterium]
MGAGNLGAQETLDAKTPAARTPGRIATTVALRSELFRGQPVVILRRPLGSGGDLIVLSGPAIAAELLATASFALTQAREESGDVVSSKTMIAISEASGASPVDVRVCARVLEKLRTAPRSVIDDVGQVQTATIYLPSKTGRESLKQRGKADFTPKVKKEKKDGKN